MGRNQRVLLLIVALFALSAIAVFAGQLVSDGETITVASYEIPLMVEDAEHGAFVELLREASRRAGVRSELRLYPPKRAMRMFEDGEVMAILPALRSTLGKDAALTVPFIPKTLHAVVREGSPLPARIADLEGLRVGVVRGFAYPRAITVDERIDLDYADTTNRSLLRLKEGRVDVVVADGYTARRGLEMLHLQGLVLDLSKTLYRESTYIAFQPTPRGGELARRFTEALKGMRGDGTLRAILPDIP